MENKLYLIGNGKMEPVKTEGKDNLKIGTVLRWHGYNEDSEVIYKKDTGNYGTIYKTINLDNLSFRSQEAYCLALTGEGVGIRVEITDKILTSDEILDYFEKATALKTAEDLKSKAHQEQTNKLVNEGKIIADKFIPSDCPALIIAEYDVNDSDIQTDYFAHKTTKLIILGVSKSKRDNFKEMRKFADSFEPTQHLGIGKNEYIPRIVIVAREGEAQAWSDWHHKEQHNSKGMRIKFSTRKEAELFISQQDPLSTVSDNNAVYSFAWEIDKEDIEHREKYSMGQGYYLKGGLGGHSTGWQVSKMKKYSGWSIAVYESLAKMCLLK